MQHFFFRLILIGGVLFYGTYLLAAFSYRNSVHVFYDEVDKKVDRNMYIVCTLNIVLGLMGNILIAARVTHGFHTIYMSILMGGVVPSFAAGGLIRQGQGSSSKEQEAMAKETTISYWREHREVWPVLKETQEHEVCCGLYGPSDYRAFIYNRDSSEGVPCEDEEYDVPVSCAMLEELYERCWQANATEFCNVYKFTKDVVVFNDIDVNAKLKEMTPNETRQYKCEHAKDQTLRKTTLCHPSSYAVMEEGCLKYMLENNSSLRNAHSAVFYIAIFFGGVKVFCLFTYWIEESRKYKDARRKSLQAERERDSLALNKSHEPVKKDTYLNTMYLSKKKITHP